MEKIKVYLYSKSMEGHRKSYIDFIKSIIPAKKITLKESIFANKPVLFLMIEESFLTYFIISILRAMLKRRTIGLLFRPQPLAEALTLRLKIKRTLLKTLKKINLTSTLSIVPSYLNESFEGLSDDWIYDFQLWDLNNEELDDFRNYRNGIKPIEIIKPQENKKPNLVAIGSQTKAKGFIKLIDFQSEANDYNIVIVGKIKDELIHYTEMLKSNNGTINNRIVSDSEIIQAYAIADYIWTVYDENYDQASGIMGRAIQLGVIPVLRKGSLMQKFCETENIQFLTIEDLRNAKVKRNFENLRNEEKIKDFRKHSIKVIKEHILK
ncbi:MAG: hypothetical protein SWN10_10690 [Pseudomonadota bacterium]|nr:hypothetical protein [Pseudomonadota bacterium]